MRKNKFLTVIFSIFPGAGQMYLGYIKRGVSLMLIFASIAMLAGLLGVSFLMFFLPVIWFFAFFDTLNLINTTYIPMPMDDYLFHFSEEFQKRIQKFLGGNPVFWGLLMIGFGVYILFKDFMDYISHYFPVCGFIADNLPKTLLSLAIIWIGVRILKSSKPGKDMDDYCEYREIHDDDEQ